MVGKPKTTATRSKQKDPLAGMVVVKVEKDNALRNKIGSGNRETLYRDHYPRAAQKLMEGGATQFEVSQCLGVSEQTLYKWACDHPEFGKALKAGGEIADNRVELALLSKAAGYKWTEEVKSKTINEVGEEVEEVTQITKQIPPDNSAIFFWLKNRRAHRWKDKHEITMNHQVNIVTSNDLQLLVSQHITDGDYKVVSESSV